MKKSDPSHSPTAIPKDIQSVVTEIQERWANFVHYRQDPAITSARRMADIDTLLGVVEPVIQSALALCRQLRAVHADPQYRNVWEMAQLHRGQYAGLTYTAELAALESSVQSSGCDPIKNK